MGVHTGTCDEGVCNVVVLHGFMQRYIDIIKEIVDSAVDDDGGTTFSRFHQPVVATASLYMWFGTQTIELGDDGMVVPHFGVFRVFAVRSGRQWCGSVRLCI